MFLVYPNSAFINTTWFMHFFYLILHPVVFIFFVSYSILLISVILNKGLCVVADTAHTRHQSGSIPDNPLG